MRVALLALLLLAGCGKDGVPLHPDGTAASVLETLDRNETITTSAGWTKP